MGSRGKKSLDRKSRAKYKDETGRSGNKIRRARAKRQRASSDVVNKARPGYPHKNKPGRKK